MCFAFHFEPNYSYLKCKSILHFELLFSLTRELSSEGHESCETPIPNATVSLRFSPFAYYLSQNGSKVTNGWQKSSTSWLAFIVWFCLSTIFQTFRKTPDSRALPLWAHVSFECLIFVTQSYSFGLFVPIRLIVALVVCEVPTLPTLPAVTAVIACHPTGGVDSYEIFQGIKHKLCLLKFNHWFICYAICPLLA